jgi:archaellum biogenesis ATPase FlaH
LLSLFLVSFVVGTSPAWAADTDLPLAKPTAQSLTAAEEAVARLQNMRKAVDRDTLILDSMAEALAFDTQSALDYVT